MYLFQNHPPLLLGKEFCDPRIPETSYTIRSFSVQVESNFADTCIFQWIINKMNNVILNYLDLFYSSLCFHRLRWVAICILNSAKHSWHSLLLYFQQSTACAWIFYSEISQMTKCILSYHTNYKHSYEISKCTELLITTSFWLLLCDIQIFKHSGCYLFSYLELIDWKHSIEV